MNPGKSGITIVPKSRNQYLNASVSRCPYNNRTAKIHLRGMEIFRAVETQIADSPSAPLHCRSQKSAFSNILPPHRGGCS